jgi:glycosyltransferase involved in cell wall biosynthesis
MDKPAIAADRIAFIGNYLPRHCGIATFTTDLCESVAREFPQASCIVLPVNDGEATYVYPPRVRYELREKDAESYLRAAEYLNVNGIDLVCLQHEYGIFGGRAGSHILGLLEELRMPVVTTFHTVLQDPDPDQRRVLERVAALSARIVVMSHHGKKLLSEVYGVLSEKIEVIPHGIPDVPFIEPGESKALFGVADKTVLLSFGLLSPDKGIEGVISALPAILKRHPHVVYIVLGATHPHVKRSEGETYRLSLQRVAAENGVEANVIFYNRFVDSGELNAFIDATDIYITPYLKATQITSGTLAYTVGAGKAVVSTPYWYAEEILAEGRGVLVPFADPAAISREVNGLLADAPRRLAMRERAYRFGRNMIWSTVARDYMNLFRVARAGFSRRTTAFAVKPLDKRPPDLPPVKLDHLLRMTDATGMYQHAVFSVPNYLEGYTTDDNARALIAAVLLGNLGVENVRELTSRYLAFLLHALDFKSGRFRNFMDYQRNWLEAQGSDDSQGRALWALGVLIGRSESVPLRAVAAKVFERGLPAIVHTTSPRAWSFALLGLNAYLGRFPEAAAALEVRNGLARRIHALYQEARSEEWPWFEESLTYCNAVLPHALMLSGEGLSDSRMLRTGLETLDWLTRLHRPGSETGHFVPIGSNGFYPRAGERSRFDQQPVEVQGVVSACLEAHRLTGDPRWRREARHAFDWFLGRNDLNLPVYDPTTGGCRDGLHPDRVNENQGAESTLAFLHSLIELRHSDAGLHSTSAVPR